MELMQQFDEALVVSSVSTDDLIENLNDPELIIDEYNNRVAGVVDAGILDIVGSTIVDCTDEEPIIIRQGLKELEM